MNRKINSFCLAVLLSVFFGCASTANWPPRSNFLNGYNNFYRSNDVKGIFVAKHRSKSINDYSKFLVDPVTVKLTPNAQAYQMDKGSLEEIAKTLREDIITALGEHNTIVDQEEEGVIRVRVAITDVLKKSKGGKSKGIVEAEFIEMSTQEQVAATLTSDKGMVLKEWAVLLKDRLDYLGSVTKTYQFE